MGRTAFKQHNGCKAGSKDICWLLDRASQLIQPIHESSSLVQSRKSPQNAQKRLGFRSLVNYPNVSAVFWPMCSRATNYLIAWRSFEAKDHPQQHTWGCHEFARPLSWAGLHTHVLKHSLPQCLNPLSECTGRGSCVDGRGCCVDGVGLFV